MSSLASLANESGLDRESCVRLTTALMHLLWEGGLLLGISALIAAGLRRQSASLRYTLQLGILVALVGCLPGTYALLEVQRGDPDPPQRIGAETVADDPFTSEAMERLITERVVESPSSSAPSIRPLLSRDMTSPDEPNFLVASIADGQIAFPWPSAQPESSPLLSRVAPFAVAIYLTGVLLMALRLLAALCGGHRLRTAAIPAVEPQLLQLVSREARRLGLKVVPAVAWCWQISTPIVVGVLRPTILLPASVVVGLSPDDLAGVLLHELAHIRRFDLVVNLFQRMVETLLFFHPAVWFVSRQISRERENCCDDCVVNAGWPRTAYAELLVRVAEACTVSMPPVATVTGVGIFGEQPSELKRRVLRLLSMEPRARLCLSRSGVILLGATLIAVVGSAALLEGREPGSKAAGQSTKDATSKTESGREGSSLARRTPTTLHGTVVTSEGKPAAGAQVAIANWSVDVQFLDGKLAYAGSAAERKLVIVETDAAGEFRLPREADPQTIVVAHPSGYAEVDDPRRDLREGPPREAELKIELQRYGRVIGSLQQGDKPIAGVRFEIGSISSHPCRRTPSRISHEVETDRTGRFVIPRMPPGLAWCQRCVAVSNTTKPLGGLVVHFEVDPGQVTNLALGVPGPTVVGKLVLPAEIKSRIVWPEVDVRLSPRTPEGFGLAGLFGGGAPNNAEADPWSAFLQSEEGQGYIRNTIPIAADGSFRVEGLFPADYSATITVPASALKDLVSGSVKETHFPIRVSLAGQRVVPATIDLGAIPLVYELDKGATRSSIPQHEQPRKSAMPDDKAQAIALRAHQLMRGIDSLPRFYLRTAEGNGTVDTQRDESACTLDGLKKAVDGPVQEGYFDGRTTLAWDGKQALWGNGPADLLTTTPSRGQYRFWTPDQAWERHQSEDQPPEFIFVPETDQLAETILYNGIFRVTPHRFWWGPANRNRSPRGGYVDPIPTELAAYRTVGAEIFDGELCDVVESVRRCERMWVSRATGLPRGVLQYYRSGEFTDSQVAAARTVSAYFRDGDDSPDLSPSTEDRQRREQSLLSALSVLDDYDGPFQPNELVCFRDFRQIAPDVWFPFREDRAFTHPAPSGPDRKKYIHLWWSAEKVRTDLNLKATLKNLGPKAGDKISQDQRFGLPVTYDYRPNWTPRDILELIQTEKHSPQMQGFQSLLTARIEQMVGKPAPLLPAERFIGGDPPRIDGTPYLLHFWADWSQPSAKDFRELRKLASEGATIIGIHPAGTPAKTIAHVIEKHQLGYPTVLAPENDSESSNQTIAGYPVWDYPWCVLVDREGRITAQGRLTPELIGEFRKLRKDPKK